MNSKERLEAALSYASCGYQVLPLHGAANGSCSCGKANCESRGKHPRTLHGLKDATSTRSTILEWWTKWPNANIGVSMGASGLVGIDVDVHDDKPGMESWVDLKREHGAGIEATAIVETPSGGLHLWYTKGPFRIGSRDGVLGIGVDVKSEGGYLVVPPSSIDGVEYAWVEGHELDCLAPLPAALGERLSFARRSEPAETPNPQCERIPKGQRHSTLVSLAGAMRARGCGENEILAALGTAAAERCEPPYMDVADIQAIGRDAVIKWPAGEPSRDTRAALNWKTAAELTRAVSATPNYICPPYFAAGFTIQLVAKVKTGKTEFIRGLIAAVLEGRTFLSQPTAYARVAYLTEESAASFGPPLVEAGLADREDLFILSRNECGASSWPAIAPAVREFVAEKAIGILVVDTGDPWLLHAGQDANDPVVAHAALLPLQQIAEDHSVLVLLVRHERKGGGDISDAGRGSSAFSGAVDLLLTLRPIWGSGHSNRRHLEALGRAALPNVPRLVTIELADGEYRLLGGDAEDVAAVILSNLPSTREAAIDVTHLCELTGFSTTPVQDTLRELLKRELVDRAKGAGTASSRAFGYWRRPSVNEP